MTRLSTIGATVMLVLAFTSANGQATDANRPRAVADSFFADVAAERWTAAARRLSLRDFERYLKQTISSARAALPAPALSVEDLLAQDSTMPRAVAEWQVERMRRSISEHRFHDFSREFAGVTSFPALAALSVPEAAARWLEARDGRTEYRAMVMRRPCADSAANAARLASTSSWTKPSVLGAVLRDDSTAYVLHSVYLPFTVGQDLSSPPPAIMMLRRTREGWVILPRHDLLRGAGSFGYSITCVDARRR